MPEGDTIYRAAENVGRVLTGKTLQRVQGSHPAIRAAAPRLEGSTVRRVRNYGKHHLIDLDSSLTIRSHMGMPGVWHVYERRARWARPVGAARIVLQTESHEAVCFAAPTVEVDATDRIDAGLAQWGPDLTADEFDTVDAEHRLTRQPAHRTIAEALLDQRVMAGVGNVFKSEILFMNRLHPQSPVRTLDASARTAVVARARQLLLLNRDRPRRMTTGDTRYGRELWVYDRDGEACRRCRTGIAVAFVGDLERVTYWCPNCQPDPVAG